jgi:hypothetical protein
MPRSRTKPRVKRRNNPQAIRKEKAPVLPPEFRREELEFDDGAPIREDIERGAVPDPDRARARVNMANPGVVAGTAMYEGGGEFVGQPDPQHRPTKPRVVKKRKPRAA